MELRCYKPSDFFFMDGKGANYDYEKIEEALEYASEMWKNGNTRHALRTLAVLVDGYRGYLCVIESIGKRGKNEHKRENLTLDRDF